MEKKLIFGTLGVAIAGALMFLANPNLLTETTFNSNYNPTLEQKLQTPAREWGGAAKYLAFLRGTPTFEEMHKVHRQIDAAFKTRPLFKVDKPLDWAELGPDNMGGRTYGIVIDKDDNKILYTASVTGGVFKSTNGGASWRKTNIDNTLENQAVRCMIQTANGDIYYGTGEFSQRFSGGDGNSGVIGRGVFKSTDKGETFAQLKATDPVTPYSKTSAWDFVYSLASPSNDGNKVFAGTNGGMYVTTDGGTTWAPVAKANTAVAGYNKCQAIRIAPDNQTMFAVMQPTSGILSALIRSKDGGANWERVGFSPRKMINERVVRMEIAIAPSNPSHIYLSAAGQNFKLDSIYKSEDGGDNWKAVLKGGNEFLDPFFTGPNGSSPQGDYDNCIVVDPTDENKVFVGGVHLYEGKKTGSSYQWRTIATLNYNFDNPSSYFNRFYIHADKHGLYTDTRTNPYTLYVTTDGGVFKSNEVSTVSSPVWKEVNNGYATIQFYALDNDKYNSNIVAGGTQDNGTIMISKAGVKGKQGSNIKGGDGGYVSFSKIDPRVIIAESQYGTVQRSLGGKGFTDMFEGTQKTNLTGTGKAPFVTPFRLWETLDTLVVTDTITGNVTKELDKKASMFVFAPYAGIWLTRDALSFEKSPTWYPLTTANHNCNTMEFSEDGKHLFVASGNTLRRFSGLENYKNFRLINGNFIRDSFGITERTIFTATTQILGIGVNPKNPNHVVITCGIYGSSIPRVYVTRDALSAAPTFRNITKNLPGFPVYDAEINGDDDKHIILATEVGIWSSYDAENAGTWREDNKGLQRVPTFMLKQSYFTDRIGPVFYAATHGRGFYRTDAYSAVSVKDKSVENNFIAEFSLYPNPATSNTNLKINLQNKGNVDVAIFDVKGRQLEYINLGNQNQGIVNYNLNTSKLNKGVYIVKVSSNGVVKTAKLLINN